MKNKILFVFIILFIFTNNVFPQCAMCKAVVEANLESGDTKEKYDKFEEITKWYSPFYGKGTYTWANGDKYVGEWFLEKPGGIGKMTYSDGRVEEGRFMMGVYIGKE